MARRTLSQLDRQARERLRLISPETAGKVLSKDIFWTRQFISLYLEHCDQVAFEDPRDAYRLAIHVPSLARLIGVGRRPGEYRNQEERRSFHVHSLAVFASVCRRIGENTEAEESFRRAFTALEDGAVRRRAKAELFYRFGNFLAKSARPPLHFFDEALELFEEMDEPAGAAQVYVLRAYWSWHVGQPGRSALDLASALSVAMEVPKEDRVERARADRAVTAAIGNLGRLLSEGEISIFERSKILSLVTKARKRLSRRPASAIKMRLFWVEGSIHRSLHFVPHALRLLVRAREGFKQLGLPQEFAQISLELAVALLEEGETEAVDELRAETISVVGAMTDDKAFLELLDTWRVKSRKAGLLDLEQAIDRS